MFNSNFNTVLDRMLTLSRVGDETVNGFPWTETPSRPQLWLPPIDIYEADAAFVATKITAGEIRITAGVVTPDPQR